MLVSSGSPLFSLKARLENVTIPGRAGGKDMAGNVGLVVSIVVCSYIVGSV